MGFVRITKSMEEVGKVILCADVFYFSGGGGGVGGGLESTGTEQPGGKPGSLIFPRTCWRFNANVYNCERFCSIATYDVFCLFHFLKCDSRSVNMR